MTKNFRDDWCEADVGRVPQPPFVQRHLVQGPLLVVTSDRLGVKRQEDVECCSTGWVNVANASLGGH